MSGIRTFRELALVSSSTQLGVTENGYDNRGPIIEEYQRSTDAGVIGFPWCAALVSWSFRRSGFDVSRIVHRASVGFFEQWARRMGFLVDRPLRGDLFCWRIDSGDWPDHIGHIERVLKLGPVFLLQTIEGNTSPGDGGSQDNGGGVYRRRRLIAKSRVQFIRIPGKPPKNPVWFLKSRTGKDAWVEWKLGIGRWEKYQPSDAISRPNVPLKIEAQSWWKALAAAKNKLSQEV
jgi:hypothetical protein